MRKDGYHQCNQLLLERKTLGCLSLSLLPLSLSLSLMPQSRTTEEASNQGKEKSATNHRTEHHPPSHHHPYERRMKEEGNNYSAHPQEILRASEGEPHWKKAFSVASLWGLTSAAGFTIRRFFTRLHLRNKKIGLTLSGGT